MQNSKVNFLKFDNEISDFLIDHSPIEKIKIVRNDSVVVNELTCQNKNLDFWELLQYTNHLKVKIVKLLIDNQKTFVKGKTKSYKIICNDNEYFEVNDICGCKENKERVVQINKGHI